MTALHTITSPETVKRRRDKPWRKRRPKGYVAPLSPSKRNSAWVTVVIRVEHHAMLRQLSDLYVASYGNTVMQLIQAEYLRTLALSDPETARQLEEEYNERFTYNPID